MNKLIKKTSRKVVSLQSYNGVCHNCNSPICFDGEMIMVEIENTDTEWRVVPIDNYVCPHCGESMQVMKIYKNLEVSKEMSHL